MMLLRGFGAVTHNFGVQLLHSWIWMSFPVFKNKPDPTWLLAAHLPRGTASTSFSLQDTLAKWVPLGKWQHQSLDLSEETVNITEKWRFEASFSEKIFPQISVNPP
eukprot:EG_transcript_44883